MASVRPIHPAACRCKKCRPAMKPSVRVVLELTRILFLFAALIMIPFVIARALVSAKGDRR